MLIKQSGLAFHLKKNQLGLYIIIGSEMFLMDEAIRSIKDAWNDEQNCEEKLITLNLAADWNTLIDEANSYSLFSDKVLIDASYDKKTIDASARNILTTYANNINSRCLIILRAPQLTTKNLQWIVSNTNTVVIQLAPLDSATLQSWIKEQLKINQLNYTLGVVQQIHEKTQGNMLATARVIEKLALIMEPHELLTEEIIAPHIMDESEHQLYELTDAWLEGQVKQSIYLLREARSKQTEPILILWLFSQTIRQLINLHQTCQQGQSLQDALSNCFRWPQQRKKFEKAANRSNLTKLLMMLNNCHKIDEGIKTGSSNRVWQELESLILLL